MTKLASLVLSFTVALASGATAQSTNLTTDAISHKFTFNGQAMSIGRQVQPDLQLAARFASSAQSCPPHCLTALSMEDGVQTVGELELLAFMSDHVTAGNGLVVDARLPDWRSQGFVPSSVNIPHATLDAENPYSEDIMRALGAVRVGDAWDFTNAMYLAIYANGAWSDAAPRLVKNLRDQGYPADRIVYYRGGMHMWVTLGLTIIQPQT